MTASSLIKLFSCRPSWRADWSSSRIDFAAYARACNADGYTVDTLEEFERAYRPRPPRSGRA
jgi:thiamine pyrophosphate-dependent acetolactate synthase large subunit-like protein